MLYLALYLGTLIVHVALVSYVLVGSGWLAVRGLLGRPDDAIAARFRDWLPFMLGAAITAGVAPLLFVQILYQERFYTANLLLGHRWLAVIPALILGFYALYLAKSERAARWPARWRAAVPTVAALCFVFVAWSWTELHLLQLRPDRWAAMYGEGAMLHVEPQLAPRLLLWLGLALPTAAAIVGAQVAGDPAALRRLRVAAWAGQGVALAAAAWLHAAMPAAARDAVLGGAGLAIAGVVALGHAVAAAAWLIAPRAPRPGLGAAGLGLLAALIAGALLRERMRWDALEAIRPQVSGAGGLWVFLLFLVFNAVVIVWCVRSARRHLAD